MSTTVTKRLVFIKIKGGRTKKRHAPLPRRPQSPPSGEMVGEKAKPFAPLAAAAPRRKQPAGWRGWLKAAAIFVGVLTVGGALAMMMKSGPKSYGGYTATEVRSTSSSLAYPRTVAVSPAARVSRPGSDSPAAVALSQRATPTDQSFLASAYVRRKVSLPNISGDCKVNGNGSRDIGACLRRAAQE